ncbi:DUF1642 domain-containing protein [Streptococcus oralis]|nr:DUF1642 domain-containing protein [Streptococcus oralis]QBX17311.1 hypothetical protein Javan349_0036 [Streptococcus phage Javan349]
MNKQELIERIEGLKNIFGNKAEYIEIDAVIELVSKLDEPQKVTIPQFVAEYIEHKKNKDYHLLGAMAEIRSYKNKEIDEWFTDDDNMELFARAWLDGYEVEKEKRYIVTLKSSEQKLYYHTEDEDYIFSSYDGVFYLGYHTKTDLEKNDMSWVFDCPGIEVKEVK